MTLVAIVLHEHQANDNVMWRVGEVIRRVALEKMAPYTFSMTGITMEAILRCCPDIASGIRWDFSNKINGWDPTKPELVISTKNNMPIVIPGLPLEYWGSYFEGFVKEQVRGSIDIAEKGLHRTPRGIFPPEMIFAPASAHILQQLGLDYCLIPSEQLGGNNWAKGQVYYVGEGSYNSNLKLVPRDNDLCICDGRGIDAQSCKDMIKEYARNANIDRVVVGCDLGHFTGLYHGEGRQGVSLQDGIARLCCLADAIYSDPDLHLVNTGAIADNCLYPLRIYGLYRQLGISDVHHYIATWMNVRGDLSSLDMAKVCRAIEFIVWHSTNLGKIDGRELQQAKERWFFTAAGMEHMMDW